MIERIAYLVGHHHTLTNIDGMDYQILIEADFIANATENKYSDEKVLHFIMIQPENPRVFRPWDEWRLV